MAKIASNLASIIIPLYNSANNITETLEALNRQTLKKFEVIVVDDGSSDNSCEIVNKFKANFPLRLIRQINSGPAVARNKGAKNSKTDIIIFLDSDCIAFPNFVEKMLEPFKDKEIVGVHGQYETKNKYSLVARYIGYEMAYRQEPMKKAERIDHMATHAAAYRKKDFGAGFSEGFRKADMEDIELSYRLAKEGKKMIFQSSAKIKHPHPESFKKFFKQQYGRGYWRALGHIKHPDKLVKDSYLGKEIAIQGILSLLLLFSLGMAILGLFFDTGKLFFFPLIAFILLYLSNLSFGIYCSKQERKMLFLAPILAASRSIVATLGFLIGFINFKLFRGSFK